MKIALIADQLCLPSAAKAGEARPGGSDPYPGDPARRVHSLARALAEHDHQVTVYSRQQSASRHGTDPGPGVAIELIAAGPRRRLSGETLLRHIAVFADQLADRWRRDAPDVIHSHFWTSGVAAVAGARGLGIPVAHTFHTLGTGDRPGHRRAPDPGARVRMEASLARSVRLVLAASTEEGAGVGRLTAPGRGAASASVRVVPPGVDTTMFRPDGPAAPRGTRARLLVVGPPGDQPELVTVLRALADLPDAELVIAGGPARGRLGRDPGYRALVRLARHLSVADRLVCAGTVREADMPPLMRSADVLVHLDPGHASSLVPVEAMACGTPVIAVAAGFHPDAVIHENTGFLVPPGQPALLARRVHQLLANPMLREGYGIAAASRARDRFSWERVSQETLAAYRAIIGPQVPAVA